MEGQCRWQAGVDLIWWIAHWMIWSIEIFYVLWNYCACSILGWVPGWIFSWVQRQDPPNVSHYVYGRHLWRCPSYKTTIKIWHIASVRSLPVKVAVRRHPKHLPWSFCVLFLKLETTNIHRNCWECPPIRLVSTLTPSGSGLRLRP